MRTKVLLIAAILTMVLVLIAFGLPCGHTTAYAAPDALLNIIVENAPEDLNFTLPSKDTLRWERRDVAWATYCTLHLEYSSADDGVIVSGGGKSFVLRTHKSFVRSPRQSITLDFSAQTFAEGKTLKHHVLCAIPVVVATVLLESVIFFLFKHRKKTSWLIFILICIVASVARNAFVYSFSPEVVYTVFARFLTEMFLSPIKTLANCTLIREFGTNRRIGYATTANLASLALGILLINILPI